MGAPLGLEHNRSCATYKYTRGQSDRDAVRGRWAVSAIVGRCTLDRELRQYRGACEVYTTDIAEERGSLAGKGTVRRPLRIYTLSRELLKRRVADHAVSPPSAAGGSIR